MFLIESKIFVYKKKYKMNTGMTPYSFHFNEIEYIYLRHIDSLKHRDSLDCINTDKHYYAYCMEYDEINAITKAMIEYDWGDVKHLNVTL